MVGCILITVPLNARAVGCTLCVMPQAAQRSTETRILSRSASATFTADIGLVVRVAMQLTHSGRSKITAATSCSRVSLSTGHLPEPECPSRFQARIARTATLQREVSGEFCEHFFNARWCEVRLEGDAGHAQGVVHQHVHNREGLGHRGQKLSLEATYYVQDPWVAARTGLWAKALVTRHRFERGRPTINRRRGRGSRTSAVAIGGRVCSQTRATQFSRPLSL